MRPRKATGNAKVVTAAKTKNRPAKAMRPR